LAAIAAKINHYKEREMDNVNRLSELCALMADLGGMIAENQDRINSGYALAWSNFSGIANDFRALKSAELAATTPAVAAPNNRSDEIAFAQSVIDLCYRDMALNQIVDAVMKLSNHRVAQLRAMR
jgi:hypothetical protein